MRKIYLLITIALLIACTDPKGTIQILTKQGYKNITITGYRPFSCWKNDLATGFTATDSNGFYVTGCNCYNVLTGSRIKIDKHK
jgi:hypothetical protein